MSRARLVVKVEDYEAGTLSDDVSALQPEKSRTLAGTDICPDTFPHRNFTNQCHVERTVPSAVFRYAKKNITSARTTIQEGLNEHRLVRNRKWI